MSNGAPPVNSPADPPAPRRPMPDPEWAGRLTMAFAQGAWPAYAIAIVAGQIGLIRAADSRVYAAAAVAVNAFVQAFLSAIFGALLFAVGVFACGAALGWRRGVSLHRARLAGVLLVAIPAVARFVGGVSIEGKPWGFLAPPALALVVLYIDAPFRRRAG